jgi:hypothetical protein
MASKMKNYIEHQQRHLSPAEFDAWVKSDMKVQAWVNKQNKIPAVTRALDDLARDIGKKAILPGLQAASDYLASIEKGDAPTAAGVLKQSIGSTKAKMLRGGSSFCGWVASGPRRGFARGVVEGNFTVQQAAKRGGWLKRLSKKATLAMTGGRKQNPTEYAYYLTHGHKAVKPIRKKALLIAGEFFARTKAVPARDFMAPARAQGPTAADKATEIINTNLKALLPGE